MIYEEIKFNNTTPPTIYEEIKFKYKGIYYQLPYKKNFKDRAVVKMKVLKRALLREVSDDLIKEYTELNNISMSYYHT